MDLGSPDRSVEENKKVDGASVAEKLDLNMLDKKGEPVNEAMNEIMQVYSNQEHSGSPVLPVGVNDEGLQSSIMKSNSPDPLPPSKVSEEPCLPIELDLNLDDVDGRISHKTEGLRSPLDDYHIHNDKEGTDYVGLSNELLDSSANETYNNKVETEDLDPSANDPLHEIDDKQACEVDDNDGFDDQSAKYRTSNAPLHVDSGNISGNSYSEKAEFVEEEIDGGNCSHHTETKEDCYPTGMVPSDNGGIEGENSGLHSPQRNRNATPSPERQLSVSPERSPRTQHSARQDEWPSPANSDRKKATSPSPSKRKRSPSPEKHSMGRKRASHDRSSPSARRRSPSDRTTQRDSYHRDNSPRKRLSASPRRRESPRRRNRSVSRSPVRRRESSGHRRDHRGRSRSRSPYSRDRYRRSPRRKHSPRHRSPPSGYSRRRSPRRPWSPPANRSTGVGRPGNNLFVAGFSYVTTERDLDKKFSRFGRVTDVRIVRDKRTGDSRGFGFLSLERDEDADAAIRALDQTEWNGRIVLVEKSKTALR